MLYRKHLEVCHGVSTTNRRSKSRPQTRPKQWRCAGVSPVLEAKVETETPQQPTCLVRPLAQAQAVQVSLRRRPHHYNSIIPRISAHLLWELLSRFSRDKLLKISVGSFLLYTEAVKQGATCFGLSLRMFAVGSFDTDTTMHPPPSLSPWR